MGSSGRTNLTRSTPISSWGNPVRSIANGWLRPRERSVSWSVTNGSMRTREWNVSWMRTPSLESPQHGFDADGDRNGVDAEHNSVHAVCQSYHTLAFQIICTTLGGRANRPFANSIPLLDSISHYSIHHPSLIEASCSQRNLLAWWR